MSAMDPFANQARSARRKLRAALVAAGVALVALAAPSVSAAATFTVTNTNDSGPGSLRQAIEDSNNNPGADRIEFNILLPPFTIRPTSALPHLNDTVTIDGTTQPGFVGSPIVELDGSLAGSSANGLVMVASSSTVRGLVINRFAAFGRAGILVIGSRNRIEGNFIGTNVTGTLALPNSEGVDLGGTDNVIGGTAASVRNVISGNNEHGILVRGSANRVEGNFIGTDFSGTSSVGNRDFGITLRTFAGLASNNTIGGTAPGARNVVSGNGSGIVFTANSPNNLVQGNFIGTDVSGTADLGNRGSGVRMHIPNNTIGGTTAEARNVISGNDGSGVELNGTDATGNLVQGNYIGTDASGTADLGNVTGVTIIAGAANNTIGGTVPGARNVISGSDEHGISFRLNSPSNLVQGNYIGTDASGTADLGNRFSGLQISTPNNTIGGTTAEARNVISGNGQRGIELNGSDATGNRVEGNYVGTDASGTADVGNGNGVGIIRGTNNRIGGTTPGARNVISGNDENGVELTVVATNNLVQGNYIGTQTDGSSALGNTGDGVHFVDPGANASNNTIGGTASGAANTIAFNGRAGVYVGSGMGNAILSNSIFSNGGLGIDLRPRGVTPNDPGDADTGANNLQNFPVLTSVSGSGGGTTVQGTLNSEANKTYRLEFFSSPSCDPSGHGEGKTFLGSLSVTTDGSGNASFTFSSGTAVSSGDSVTATATDPANNTSEFSRCKQAEANQPATLTLSPATDTNTAGEQHCVTATVKDASGNPTPNIAVRFSVTGANSASGSATTNSNGEATFCYTGTNAGQDAITAFADTDNDGTQDAGEPTGVATKTYVPAGPATLTLSPPADSNDVETEHCVTATVKDAFGNPVPNVTVRFSVTGSVTTSGSATTDAGGEAEFCYQGPELPGADAITAFADSDNDETQDAGEPTGAAEKTWVLPVSTPLCEVKLTKGGRITADNGDKATFGGNAKVSELGMPSGDEEYQDHGPAQPLNVKSTQILALFCPSSTQATIFGIATIDGQGTHLFKIDVEDLGEPGVGADTYRILLDTLYDSGENTLEGGNVQIHKG